MCESLGSDARLETAVPTVLDLMGIPYTGSPPEALSGGSLQSSHESGGSLRLGAHPRGGLVEWRDAPVTYLSPSSASRRKRRPGGDLGKSVVHDEESLRERVAEVINLFKAPCLVEQYTEGRELNVALLDTRRHECSRSKKSIFRTSPPSAPHRLLRRQVADRLGRRSRYPAGHAPRAALHVAARLRRAATEACRAVGVRDYGRVDIRLSATGVPSSST